MNKQLIRMANLYERRVKEMVPIIYSAFALAMKRELGSEYEDILRVLAESQALWDQSKRNEIDILEKCYDETGISIMSEYTAMETGQEGDEI